MRVRVLAACVQFSDVIIRKRKDPGLGRRLPLVLGCDRVGGIDRVWPGDVPFRVGERVAALTVTGSYALAANAASARLARVQLTAALEREPGGLAGLRHRRDYRAARADHQLARTPTSS